MGFLFSPTMPAYVSLFYSKFTVQL